MFSNGDLQWIGTDLESMVFYQSNTCVILLIQEWWINKHNQQVVPVERLKAELGKLFHKLFYSINFNFNFEFIYLQCTPW